MNDNFDFNEEAAKALIEDNTNVSETNPLRDLFQICVKLLLVIAIVYFSIFLTSGIILKTISVEHQIVLEDFLTDVMDVNTKELSQKEKDKLLDIKQRILLRDSKYPPTSKLNIEVVDDKNLNALCYPNGTIYITSALFDKLKTDEQLMFVIAHEMAHYRNKDHLMNLRKNIAGGVVVILLSVANGSSDSNLVKMVDDTISLTDLKFSRRVEEKADIYAGKILLKEYGNVKGGIEVLNILNDNHGLYELELISTHPVIKKRIAKLQQLK